MSALSGTMPSSRITGMARICACGHSWRIKPAMKVPWPVSDWMTGSSGLVGGGGYPAPAGPANPSGMPLNVTVLVADPPSGNHGCEPRPVSGIATTGARPTGGAVSAGSGSTRATGARPPEPGRPYSLAGEPPPPPPDGVGTQYGVGTQ